MPTYRAEGSRSPRPSGKSRLGRPDPRHRKVISEFLPCAQLCAGRPRVGKGLKAALPFYMDDINIHEINSCLSAYDVAVPDSSILSDEVVVVWRDSMEVGSYRVNYWAEGAGPDDTISLTIGDTVTSLENLTPNTVYYVTVTTLCSGGEAYSTYPVSFRTACLPVATASLPYVEDFESYASGAANPISPCWYKATSSTTAFPRSEERRVGKEC